MRWEDAIQLINKAYEKEFENKAFNMWLTLYPNMDKKNFISFDDYKRKITTTTIERNSNITDILKDVDDIRKLKALKKESEK